MKQVKEISWKRAYIRVLPLDIWIYSDTICGIKLCMLSKPKHEMSGYIHRVGRAGSYPRWATGVARLSNTYLYSRSEKSRETCNIQESAWRTNMESEITTFWISKKKKNWLLNSLKCFFPFFHSFFQHPWEKTVPKRFLFFSEWLIHFPHLSAFITLLHFNLFYIWFFLKILIKFSFSQA